MFKKLRVPLLCILIMSAAGDDKPAACANGDAPKGFDSEQARAEAVAGAGATIETRNAEAAAATARGEGMAAAVVGATGATGRQLVRQLIDSPAFRRVTTIGRRRVTAAMVGLEPSAFDAAESTGKLVQHEVDYKRHLAAAATLPDAGAMPWGAGKARVLFHFVSYTRTHTRVAICHDRQENPVPLRLPKARPKSTAPPTLHGPAAGTPMPDASGRRPIPNARR